MAKIVCVEDEIEIRRILVDELVDQGHEVIAAANGAEGVRAILEAKPDAVISDCLMPEMSGAEMLRRIRTEHQMFEHLPFLFLSAYGDMDHVGDVMELGADAYLTKPVDLDELIHVVDTLLVASAGPS